MYSLSCAVYVYVQMTRRMFCFFFGGGGGGGQIFSILELFLHHHVVTFAMPSGHFSCVSGKTSLKSECNVKCSNPNLNMLSSMNSSSGLFWMFDHCGESRLGAGFVAPFCLLEGTTHLH